jgi:hypothetical protein
MVLASLRDTRQHHSGSGKWICPIQFRIRIVVETFSRPAQSCAAATLQLGWFTIRQRTFARERMHVVGAALAYRCSDDDEKRRVNGGFAVRICITAPARFISLHQGLKQ